MIVNLALTVNGAETKATSVVVMWDAPQPDV
jgi:hypothetical protein